MASSVVPESSHDEEAALAKERSAWWKVNFSIGPDGILLTLWLPAVINVMARDGVCDIFDGLSSGADGEMCTIDNDWNYSLWNSLNGTEDCIVTGAFGDERLIYDCAALSDYRSAVAGGFSCNCTGNHAYLAGSIRTGAVTGLDAAKNSFLLACMSPLLGSYLDFSSRRRRWWVALWIASVVSTCMMAIIGRSYLWFVALMAGGATAVLSDLMWIPRSSFLIDIAQNDQVRAYLGGMQQAASFGSQVTFVVIVLAMGGALNDEVLTAQLASLGAALWLLVLMPIFLFRIRERPRRRDPGKNGMVHLCVFELWQTVVKMPREYPQATKFLLSHALAQNCCMTIITQTPTYFTLQMKLSGDQIGLISASVLLVGTLAALLLSILSKRIAIKKLWIGLLCLWVFNITITPLIVYREGDFMSAVLVGGCLYGIGLSWFFSLGYATFTAFTPMTKNSQFTGVYALCNRIIGIAGPLLYGAVAQATNSQRIAFSTMMPFFLASLFLMTTIDFEKAKLQARAEVGG